MTTEFGLLAMQKVVGSSPISRLESPADRRVFSFLGRHRRITAQEEGVEFEPDDQPRERPVSKWNPGLIELP